MAEWAMMRDGTLRPYLSPWPAHPTMVATGGIGVFDLDHLRVGDVGVVLLWVWRTCIGGQVTADARPAGAVCHQPGVCVVHDPPGTLVPW